MAIDRRRVSGEHAVVVLAAGGSGRLGVPKQWLERNGEPLVRRAVRIALETEPRVAFVVTGDDDARVVVALTDLHCETVRNDAWRQGLASSLRCIAVRLDRMEELVLILGCDQPALEGAHLRALLRAADASPARAAASHYLGTVGTPAVVPASWFGSPALTGDCGFGQRLRSSPGIAIIEAAELALDIDTPADLAQARALGVVDR